jgi:hypothetical protein
MDLNGPGAGPLPARVFPDGEDRIRFHRRSDALTVDHLPGYGRIPVRNRNVSIDME